MRNVCLVLLIFSAAAVLAGPGLAPVFKQYGELQAALAADDFEAARKAAGTLKKTIGGVDASGLADDVQKAWKSAADLPKSVKAVADAGDIAAARASFESVSNTMIALAEVARPDGFARFRCPMAFNNKGADWLQTGDQVNNPYYGASMLRCGYKVRAKKKGHDHKH